MELRYIYDRYLRPNLEPLGLAIEIEGFNLTSTGRDQPATIKRVDEADLDVILTSRSTEYLIYRGLTRYRTAALASYQPLHIGRDSRGAGEVLDAFACGTPEVPNEARYDFSIAPLIYNDAHTFASFFVEETTTCDTFLILTALDSGDVRLFQHIFRDALASRGACMPDSIVVPENTSDYSDVIARLDSLNREGACVMFLGISSDSLSPLLQQYARFIDEERRGRLDTTFITDYRLLQRAQNDSQQKIKELLSSSFRAHTFLYSFSTDDNHSLASKLNARYLDEHYSAVYERECGGEGDSECAMYPPAYIASNPFVLAYHADIMTASVLAMVKAHVDADFGDVSPKDLRDAFLSITSGRVSATPCSWTDIDACFDDLVRKKEIHYTGLSSPMVIGEDARMKQLYEVLSFGRLNTQGDYVESAIYKADEMRGNYENAPPPMQGVGCSYTPLMCGAQTETQE